MIKTVEDYLREKESDPNAREKAVAMILPYYKTLHPWCILKKALATGPIGTMGIPILEPDKERAEMLLDDNDQNGQKGTETGIIVFRSCETDFVA